MIVRSLSLRAFRAHAETDLDLSSKVNLFHGPNGAGKTNILEAVHFLCLSKSFLTANDRLALRRKALFFELTANFSGRRRKSVEIRLIYHRREGKRIFANGAPVERLSNLVGMLPVVSFSPGDMVITAGAPEDRRRFINNILCQERAAYMEQLLRYRRVLRQRNELLAAARRSGKVEAAAQESWDAALVEHGSWIIAARLQFLSDFAAYLQTAYQQLSSISEKPAIAYRGVAPLVAGCTLEDIQAAFWQRLNETAQKEREQGRTLVGPHRDEVRLSIDGFDLRQYGSQGQHRTFGIGIKLAQYLYLQHRLDEPPILLLDDVFDSLDAKRAEALLALLQSEQLGQSLITAAEYETVSRFIAFETTSNRRIGVRAGRVEVIAG